jgi:DDE_Tnp_1-associated
MESTIDLASCLADIPDRRRAEGKMYGQVGVILFSIIAMLSGARSYRQIHTLIDRRLAILNAAFPQAALRRSPASTSVRGILQRLDPAELEQAFRRRHTRKATAREGLVSRPCYRASHGLHSADRPREDICVSAPTHAHGQVFFTGDSPSRRG